MQLCDHGYKCINCHRQFPRHDSSGFLDFDNLVDNIRRQLIVPNLTIRGDHYLLDMKGFGLGPKSEWIQKSIKHLYLYLFHYPAKKRKHVKKKQLFANDIMLGHWSFKCLLETGEAKTCKHEKYAYRSC